MTKKENSKTKEKPISEGKKALAELASLKNEVEQLELRAELQEKMGVRLFNPDEVKERFILDEIQSAPYIRGRENKKQGEPVLLMKCEFKKGREDLFYIFKKGREAFRLTNRYSTVPQKPKETIREKIDQADLKQASEKRYSKADKKLSKKEVIKQRYGK